MALCSAYGAGIPGPYGERGIPGIPGIQGLQGMHSYLTPERSVHNLRSLTSFHSVS